MTITEAKSTIYANVVYACEKAGLAPQTTRLVQDACDTIIAIADACETIVALADRKTEPTTHDDYIESENDYLEARCLNCANSGSYKCSKCDGEMYFKDEPHIVGKHADVIIIDEPQTEMTTEQIVNELLSIKQILDDGKLPKQRCGNCKHLTYRWNKTWCDIKCDNPHDMVCDKWERSE